MKNTKLDHIVLYLIVACFILTIAAVARLFALKVGFDSFSLFIIFVVAVAVQVIVYISIHSFMDRMLLPIIGKLLSKIPFIRRRIEEREGVFEYDAEYVEYEVDDDEPVTLVKHPELPEKSDKLLSENAEPLQETENEEGVTEAIEESALEEPVDTTPQSPSIEEIRQAQLEKRALEQEEQINIAIEYTRKAFVLYTSEEDLEVLVQNLHIYINNLEMKELKPIKVNELTINDLRHYGWNIWNHFRPRNQMDIAHFLKNVFPELFKETEVESIKRHLRDDEKKGVIKIIKKIEL
ncbi:MAG: hypothetical protein PHY15_06230 [Eubacteriales bacterium]|nr:hypothetical protein [Eubacteriales bacterium]